MTRSRAGRFLWTVAVTIGLLFLAKSFVADVYRVDTGSMRPTIFAGPDAVGEEPRSEWVLVRFQDDPELERFDLVVLRGRNGGDAVVKRACGLPGESLLIVDGDLVIRNEYLGPDVPRPRPVPVFDDRRQDVEEYFHFKSAPDGPWVREAETWHLDATDIARGSQGGMMFYHPDLRDDHLDLEGRPIAGRREVNDVLLALEFRVDAWSAASGGLRFQLAEQGDTFELWIEPSGDAGRVNLGLVHRSASMLQANDPGLREEIWAEGEASYAPGTWVRLDFQNVDNHVRARLPELDLQLSTSYEANEPHHLARTAQETVGARVSFGATGCRARFRSIRILRDLFYTGVGDYAVEEAVSLGPGEYFLLGDNSVVSKDSRHFGPIRSEEIIGRPVAVVWPVRQARGLSGAEAPGL